MTKFLAGFFIGLGSFLALNLLAAHFLSDCGLPAVFGISACADDIVRAGFPLVFLQQGGFAFSSSLDPASALIDLAIGVTLSAGLGFWLARRT
jgi:hypothetical protein